MATKEELLAQGKTEQQIQDAVVAKNTAAMSEKLGQDITPTSYPIAEPVAPIQTAVTEVINQQPQPVPGPQNITPPQTIEKTTTITPEGETVVKKEIPTTDFNVGAGREQEIIKNLNEGFASSPDLFQNQDTFRASYGYAAADDTKKRMLDAFFQAKNAQQNNPDALFQQIISNQTIQNPAIRNTPAFKSAQTRASDLTINSGLTAKELSDQIKNGSITIGSQAYNDLKATNPQLVQSAERLNAINTGMGAKIDTNTIEANVGNNIIKNVPKEEVPNLQNMLANNAQVKTALDTSKATKSRLDTIQDTLDNLEDDIKKQYEGKDVTSGYLQALISEKSKPLIRELNTLNRTYSNQLAELQYYSNIVKDDYETAKEERKTASEREYEATRDAREFGQQKELAQFQQQLGLEGKQAEFEQQMKQKAQIARDPVLATQEVIDTYAKLGILPERSNAEIIQSVQNDIASGMTLGQSLTNLNKAFQSKPQYKALIAPKPTAQPQVWTKLDDTTLLNQATGETKSVSSLTKGASATDLLSVPSGTVIPSRLSETTNPNNGKECAEFVNDIVNIGMGNSYASKVAKTNTQIASQAGVGNIAVWNPNPKDPEWNKYGHAGIITQDLGDSWEITSSNLHGDGAVTRDIVPKKSIYSYNTEKKVSVPSTKATTGTDIVTLGQFLKDNQSRGPGYSEEDVKAFDAKIDRFIKTGDEKGMALSFRKNLMEDKDFKEEFDNTQKFVKALDTVQMLVNDYEKSGKNTNAAKAFAEKIARGLGVTTDTALAQLQTQMGFTLANYIRSISGTAASDTEVQRLMGNMAQLGNVKDLNTAIVSQAKNNGLSGLKSMIDSRMYGMPDALKPLVFGDIYGQAEANIQIGANSTDEDILNYLNQ